MRGYTHSFFGPTAGAGSGVCQVLDIMRGSCRIWCDHGPSSHAYNVGREDVGVFTDQADIACTKREAKGEVFGRVAGRVRAASY